MRNEEYNEVINFANELKVKGMPLIIEYKNNTPVKLFYKPPQNEWVGIAVLEEKERLFVDQKYCGLLISERAGIVILGMYDVNIRGSYWDTLKIEDSDIYVQNAINEVKATYEAYRRELMENGEIIQPFDLKIDIILKDCYMDVYCRQQKNAGIEILYY